VEISFPFAAEKRPNVIGAGLDGTFIYDVAKKAHIFVPRAECRMF
jgi:hypothetical protein